MIKLKHSALLPVGIFTILLVIYLISSFLTGSSPVIEKIVPSVAFPGEEILIEGRNFGSSTEDGFAIIAGIRPTLSSYSEWSDTRIRLKVPDGVGSGRLFVKTRNKLSNGLLFTNREHIPVLVSGPAGPGQPYIEDIFPKKGFVGERVTLKGLNLGGERGTSQVLFSFFSSDNT
ncbi:MAG: IPT/TIG domain-containing protein, partial [Spirochaetales bacterium]|nr:IPT/TIG domain-containing protein [Spirochaetales bacterium]